MFVVRFSNMTVFVKSWLLFLSTFNPRYLRVVWFVPHKDLPEDWDTSTIAVRNANFNNFHMHKTNCRDCLFWTTARDRSYSQFWSHFYLYRCLALSSNAVRCRIRCRSVSGVRRWSSKRSDDIPTEAPISCCYKQPTGHAERDIKCHIGCAVARPWHIRADSSTNIDWMIKGGWMWRLKGMIWRRPLPSSGT